MVTKHANIFLSEPLKLSGKFKRVNFFIKASAEIAQHYQTCSKKLRSESEEKYNGAVS